MAKVLFFYKQLFSKGFFDESVRLCRNNYLSRCSIQHILDHLFLKELVE